MRSAVKAKAMPMIFACRILCGCDENGNIFDTMLILSDEGLTTPAVKTISELQFKENDRQKIEMAVAVLEKFWELGN